MKGAREYSDVLSREIVRFNKLYIVSGEHGRGRTLRIWILDIPDVQIDSIYTYKNAVPVYGVINGHEGLTEEYGWLHHGPWEQDFMKFIAESREAKRLKDEEFARNKAEDIARTTAHQKSILAIY